MKYIADGIVEAFRLLVSLNPEVYGIIGLSLVVSLTSTLISGVIGLFSGMLLGLRNFAGKKALVRMVFSFMALPPVVVGLFVAVLISRRGPFGVYELMFTPTAMVIAQTLLITPIMTGLTYSAVRTKGTEISEVATALGATGLRKLSLLISELRRDIAVAVTTGFGRGISEVGAVMLVGGNIKGHTRVMTTYIAMNNSMGNYEMSIAMGLVLVGIAIATNMLIHRWTGDDL